METHRCDDPEISTNLPWITRRLLWPTLDPGDVCNQCKPLTSGTHTTRQHVRYKPNIWSISVLLACMFITAFTKAIHWIPSVVTWTQATFSHPISWKSNLLLSHCGYVYIVVSFHHVFGLNWYELTHSSSSTRLVSIAYVTQVFFFFQWLDSPLGA